ncbi:MAG: hypothetical protein CMI02_04705 [Oceanospirillaceae bacterium]|nr:hypothetical protein [Oceanospirillaceae bacterium]MBT11320.1 hypothetical protein [Oceanospirillaceae bacterium]|tara:strand:- start:116710 stop:117657 length:948 start_codon:yes stop_codon:yes gene_type:complete
MTPSLKKSLLAGLGLLALSGCASKVVNYDAIAQEAKRDAAMADESASRTIQHAQSKLELGRSENLAYYAPRHLAEAEKSLLKAQDMLTSGEADGVVKTQAMTSLKTLEAGLQVKQAIQRQLKPAFDHRKVLQNIKADEYFPGDYAGLEESLVEIMSLMEDQQTLEAEAEQKKLLARMHQVEVNTIEYIQLKPVKDLLQRVENKGGADVAPISWQTAQKSLLEAQALISKTPRAKGAIARVTVAATKAAQHAEVITDLTNQILNSSKDDGEAIALKMERWLYKISTALKHDDIRHLPLNQQASEYAKAIEELMRSQ